MGAAVRAVTILQAHEHVLVVGGGLAGWRFIEECRRRGFEGPITLVSAESHLPYDRPPLSKQVLAGKWDFDEILLATPERLAGANSEVLLGDPAVALDVDTHTVTLASGRALQADRVVIATGTRARRLPTGEGVVHYLRHIDDVAAIRTALTALAPPARVAIVGAGFIGAEAATALHGLGAAVTVFEAASAPLVTVLGPTVAGWLRHLPDDAGVTLLTDQRIESIERDGADVVVTREGAEALHFDLVLAGVGALPNTEWLESSGLDIDNGVVVDDLLCATPTIAALGDVARFWWESVSGRSSQRIEHWQVANDQAARLAQTWCSPDEPLAPLIPYFWSDQYGAKIQVLGRPSASDDVVLVRGEVGQSWVAVAVRNDVVVAIITLRQPRALMRSRELLTSPHSLADALALAPWNN
jgi:NADPH-dependent 2,4-dienoyl-CoA reductase/sulfur reductase-like enzyme